ncbi:hypothetical protein SLS62_004450 [Diatrype stigma]|uniref:Cytochrome P450 n=1 Tax=Diatrype stigma TaxID=117547 RepID=A0AAN9UUT2_9PEZI
MNAVTKLPYWIAALRGDHVRWMQQLHSEYGSVVRFGPNDLSYTDPQAWKDIYGYQKGRKENPKDKRFYPEPDNAAPALADIPDTARHAIVRRFMAPAFSDRAIKEQETLFQQYAELMVTSIRRFMQDRGYVDMVKMYNLTTFDIMAKLTYGDSFGLLETSEYTPWVELIFKSISFVPLIQLMCHYPILGVLFKKLEPKSVERMRISHHKYCVDLLDKTLAKGPNYGDLWNPTLPRDGKESLLPVPELQTNAQMLMAAGTETSATLLSGLTYLLLRNPRSMRLLTEEIRGVFNSSYSKKMSFDSLARLPYLNACIEEGLRMYPPVPQGFQRSIAKGGNMVLGTWLPEGDGVA